MSTSLPPMAPKHGDRHESFDPERRYKIKLRFSDKVGSWVTEEDFDTLERGNVAPVADDCPVPGETPPTAPMSHVDRMLEEAEVLRVAITKGNAFLADKARSGHLNNLQRKLLQTQLYQQAGCLQTLSLRIDIELDLYETTQED